MTVTAEHVKAFAEITGDYNPLHFDEAFAAGTTFGRLVVQGGITSGILNALVAMDMLGPGTVSRARNSITKLLFSLMTRSRRKQRCSHFTIRNRLHNYDS
jgi:acyl dehydratase|tara:strand:+ start:41 stop:340 length:300 start_codon:yes stop_codon:yes gene_type:complete